MLRRLALIPLLALGLLVPAAAQAARPPAADVAKPRIRWVHVLQAPAPDGLAVEVLVQHAPLGAPVTGTQVAGTVTVILSRFEGDRNHTIAGGTAAWALPVDGLAVVYRVPLDARQSAAATAAAKAGVLRAIVLVDERARARGRAPARDGDFLQADARILAVPSARVVAAPYLTGNGRRVVIDADARGRQFATSATSPISGGRTLVLATHAAIAATDEPVALTGTATITGADGAVLATLRIPDGATLAVSPTGRHRATLVWPALVPEGTDPVEAGSALLSPAATR